MDLKAIHDGIRDVAAKSTTPVGSGTLPGDKDAIALTFSKDLPTGLLGAAKWAFGIGVQAGIRVINDVSDTDPDSIIGKVDNNISTTDPRPVIQFDSNRAWLRYGFEGNVKGGATAASGVAAITVSGQGHAEAGAYLPVDDRSITLQKAVESQLAAFPIVFNVDDIRNLAKDAAAFAVAGGQLSASLTLSWADLFTGPIAELRACAPAGAPLVFDAKASAEVSFKLTFSDSFRVVFAGLGNNKVRLCVNRASSNAFSVDPSVTVSVGLQDPGQIQAMVAPLFAQLTGPHSDLQKIQDGITQLIDLYDATWKAIQTELGDAAEQVNDVLDKLGTGTALKRLEQLQRINDEVAAVAPQLAERLGSASVDVHKAQTIIEHIQALPVKAKQEISDKLDDALGALNLRPMLEDAHTAVAGLLSRINSIEDAIKSAAESRVTLGVEYEYKRLSTNGTLFSADIDTRSAKFANYHMAALGLDITALLAAASTGDAASGITMRLFLHRTSLTRTWTLGLTLGKIGSNWSGGSTWVTVDRVVPTDRAVATEHSVSLKGYNGYAGHWFGGRRADYRGDFSAEFSSENSQLGAWRYALSLQYEKDTGTKPADSDWIEELADHAELWQIVAPDQGPELAERLKKDLNCLGHPIRANCTITVGNRAFATDLCDRLAAITEEDVVNALAAALPYYRDFDTRRSVSRRAKAYRNVVKLFLALPVGDPINMRQVGESARTELFQIERRLATAEVSRGLTPSSAPHWTAASVAYFDCDRGKILQGTRGIIHATQSLRHVADARADGKDQRRLLQESLDNWKSLWADGYSLRWFGALLVRLASRSTTSYKATTSVMRLQVGTGNDQRQIVVAPPA